jgi:hypothetical protein
MINIEGIPIVSARLAAAEKNKRIKQRRAMLKASRTPMKGEGRKEEVCST